MSKNKYINVSEELDDFFQRHERGEGSLKLLLSFPALDIKYFDKDFIIEPPKKKRVKNIKVVDKKSRNTKNGLF